MKTSQHVVVLTQEERRQLETLARSRTTQQRTTLRCRIVLAAAEGTSNQAIAQALKVNRHTVEIWRQRFAQQGLKGLKEAARPGRPARLSPEKVQTVIGQVVQPPQGRRRWSCRSMARHSGVSKSQVHRLWRANELKPHLRRTFKLSKDKHFEKKFWDVIGLYLNPPDKSFAVL
jgi:transposase